MNKPPTFIQRYRIIRLIGQGGMGALYLAADPALDRMTAIKVLREDNEELRERFAREARSAARLSHVNIVTIYDVGEHQGAPFIAMEYVEGKTLAELIRQGITIALRQKLDWMYELCDGLEHAHRAQIVHRDIKPANIMIAANAHVKILDFGIARLGESSMTQAGMLVGTLNYMAPEQIMGQGVTTRSDIFAVGAVCYELLSGKQAFPGGLDSGILHRIMSTNPESLDRLCPGIDSEIVRIVNRAMAKEPDARYTDLSVMRRDLDRVRQRFAVVDASPTIISRPTDETMAVEPTPRSEIPRSQVPKSEVPRSERRKSGREGLARRRASEVASFVSAARDAVNAGRLEEAVAACERALLLDEENEEVLELLDRARAAIDAQQVGRWLEEAKQALEAGGLTKASELLEQALAFAPDSAEAAKLGERVRKERERRASVADAIAQGKNALEEGAHDRAVAAANLALALDPGNATAQAMLSRAEAAAAAIRRQQELDRRAEKAVTDARARFARGELDEALTLLQAFSPAHPAVSAALQSLREEAREIKRRRKAEEEHQRRIQEQDDLVRRARLAIQAEQFDEARRLLADADAIPIDHADIAAVAGEIGEAEERVQEQAARREAEAAAAQRAAEDAARNKIEADHHAAEEQRRRQAEEAARRQKEEEARRAASATAEEQRRAAEAIAREEKEAAKRAKEEEARQKKEADARRKDEDAQRKKDEAERRKAADAQRKEEEAARRAEEERRRAADAAARRAQEEAAARAAAEEARRASAAAQTVFVPPAPRAAPSAAPTDATVIVSAADARAGRVGPSVGPAGRPLPPVKVIGGVAAAIVVIAVAVVWRGGSTRDTSIETTTSSVAVVTSAPPTSAASTTSAAGPPATTSAVTVLAAAPLVIDALPWAEIVEVRNAANALVPLPARATPLALAVPPGQYSVTLRNTNEGGDKTIRVSVDPASGGKAFAEFRKIDPAEYFRKVGW